MFAPDEKIQEKANAEYNRRIQRCCLKNKQNLSSIDEEKVRTKAAVRFQLEPLIVL